MNTIELTTKQRSKIKRCVKGLNDVLVELQQENPDSDIHWYLQDSDNLNLMSEPSHTEPHQDPNHDGVIELFDLKNSSGGGW